MPPQNDEERAELERLITQIREGKRDFGNRKDDKVAQAVSKLKSRGWLADGSLIKSNFRESSLWRMDLSKADLNRATLIKASLFGANLSEANLSGAVLFKANLRAAYLSEANLFAANLREAKLSETKLSGANLSEADLRGANLRASDLREANLRESYLSNSNLIGADLSRTNLSEAEMSGANLSGATLNGTILVAIDLSDVKGLENIVHNGPSHIDYMTLYKSGSLPESFLKGCGVPELLRIYLQDLIAAEGKLYSTFISYSHNDKRFAQKLHDALQKAGARVWLDEKRMMIGQNIYGTVKHAIHGQDRLILICSENSLKSNWVDREVNIALERELELKEDDDQSYVIMPISIDNFVFSKECNFEWAPELKRRLIGDFQKWENPVEFQKSLDLLIRSLQLM